MKNNIILTAVGDVFPANLSYHRGKGIISCFNKHNGSPWKEVFLEVFGNSDIGLINLEAPILPKAQFNDNLTFAGNENFITFLKYCGINVVNIANNHILEYGEHGFKHTIEILQNNRMNIIGRYNNPIFNYYKDDLKISIASFNAINDIINPQLYQDYNVDTVLEYIDKMKDSDFKILVFHWGNEYINIPTYEQIEHAKLFIDSGADIIIGHHPHVIQPIMEYKNGIICYSLGNFLFDMTYRKNVQVGLTVKFLLEKGHKPIYQVKGIYINKNFTPIIMDPNDFDKIYSKHKELFEKSIVMPKDDYEMRYNSLLRKQRALQRIIMKKDLLSNIINLSKEDFKYIKHKLFQKKN